MTSLRDRLFGPNSPAWVMGEAALSGVLSFVSLLAVGRIIGPDAVGVAAVAIALFLLLDMITAALFADALVQHPSLAARHADSAATACALIGAATGLLMAGFGPWLLAKSVGPEARPILLALAAMLPLSAFANAAFGLLVRAQRFRLLSMRVLVGQPLAVAVGLILAWAGLGPWAMIGLQVTATGFGFLLVVLGGGLGLRPRLDRAALRELWPVAGPQFAANLVELGKYRLFTLALGILVAEAVVARSHFAFRVLDAALVPVWQVTCRLALPRLCALQNDRRRLADAYGDLAQLHALTGLPVAVGLALVAPDLVRALLGPAWAGTAEAVRVAGLAAAVFFAFGSYGSLFVAVGRTRWNLGVAGAAMAIQFASLAVFRPTTPQGIAMVWAIPALVLPPVILYAVLRQLGRPLPWLAKRVAPALLATGTMAAAVLSVQRALEAPPPLVLLASVLSGGAAFLSVAWLALGRRLPTALAGQGFLAQAYPVPR